MNTIEITNSNLEETLKKNDIVLLDFWASWCGPCRMFGPIFEKAAAKHQGLVFGKVNTETQQELAASFQIRSIPTLMVFRENILVFEQPGVLPESALDELIKQVKALDMEKVKKEIATHEQENVTS